MDPQSETSSLPESDGFEACLKPDPALEWVLSDTSDIDDGWPKPQSVKSDSDDILTQPSSAKKIKTDENSNSLIEKLHENRRGVIQGPLVAGSSTSSPTNFWRDTDTPGQTLVDNRIIVNVDNDHRVQQTSFHTQLAKFDAMEQSRIDRLESNLTKKELQNTKEELNCLRNLVACHQNGKSELEKKVDALKAENFKMKKAFAESLRKEKKLLSDEIVELGTANDRFKKLVVEQNRRIQVLKQELDEQRKISSKIEKTERNLKEKLEVVNVEVAHLKENNLRLSNELLQYKTKVLSMEELMEENKSLRKELNDIRDMHVECLANESDLRDKVDRLKKLKPSENEAEQLREKIVQLTNQLEQSVPNSVHHDVIEDQTRKVESLERKLTEMTVSQMELQVKEVEMKNELASLKNEIKLLKFVNHELTVDVDRGSSESPSPEVNQGSAAKGQNLETELKSLKEYHQLEVDDLKIEIDSLKKRNGLLQSALKKLQQQREPE